MNILQASSTIIHSPFFHLWFHSLPLFATWNWRIIETMPIFMHWNRFALQRERERKISRISIIYACIFFKRHSLQLEHEQEFERCEYAVGCYKENNKYLCVSLVGICSSFNVTEERKKFFAIAIFYIKIIKLNHFFTFFRYIFIVFMHIRYRKWVVTAR